LFKINLFLVCAPYTIKASVSLEVFRASIATLEDGPIKVMEANWARRSLLCSLFGFGALAWRLSGFHSSAGIAGRTVNAETHELVAGMEERVLARERDAAVLQVEFVRLPNAMRLPRRNQSPQDRRLNNPSES
jgi:hypothetical protein